MEIGAVCTKIWVFLSLDYYRSPVNVTIPLAKREKVTKRYIGRLLQLAFLAPDIMQSIAKGDIPADLTLDRLEAGFPLGWNEQQKALGFKT